MAEKKTPKEDSPKEDTAKDDSAGKSGTATVKPKRSAKPAPKHRPPQMLPPWKVLLHNDDKNDVHFVVLTIVELTTLNEQDAKQRTVEAHETGVALLVTTHKERAELYKDQFESKGLTVSIEPAEQGSLVEFRVHLSKSKTSGISPELTSDNSDLHSNKLTLLQKRPPQQPQILPRRHIHAPKLPQM